MFRRNIKVCSQDYNQLYAGMVMIELMLSLALGFILLSILLSMYLVSQRAYDLQKSLQDIQDYAKTAITILNTDIKKAGYIGCRQLTKDFSVLSSLPYSITVQNRLFSRDGYIQVKHMSHPSGTLQETMKSYSTLSLDQEVRFSVGDIGVIADCQHAEIFKISSIKSTKQSQILIIANPLKTIFKKNTEVGKLEINEYFIEKKNTLHTGHASQYSLYMRDIHHKKTELVPHINGMKITYSINQGNELIDVLADHIVDWSTVQGVSIDLEFNISSITKVWHTYISLRI
jgi:type IV pilus assembly protein PilW